MSEHCEIGERYVWYGIWGNYTKLPPGYSGTPSSTPYDATFPKLGYHTPVKTCVVNCGQSIGQVVGFPFFLDLLLSEILVVGCSPNWTVHTDKNVRGGIARSAGTVQQCRIECIYNGSCTAIDWNNVESSGRQCWLHGDWTRGTIANRTGVDHHIVSRTCG